MSDQPTSAATPLLTIQACDCGSKGCHSIMVSMEYSQIREVKDTGELASVVYFSADEVQKIVDHLRRLAAEKGVLVK